MGINSTRQSTVVFTGDLNFSFSTSSANSSSPGVEQLITLASGANTIAVPTAGTVPTACTIVKPAGNVVAITLKGASGDTGVPLHPTQHDTISVGAAVTSFVLTAATQVVGVRLIWS